MKQLLVISGLDPSGGAGFLADARVATEQGVRVVGVVTATTTQDTRGVRAVHPVASVGEELELLLDDVRVDAVKIGMLGGFSPARLLAKIDAPIVWDPVLRPSRGDVALGAPDAELLALATLVTPNLDEASVLTGFPVKTIDDMRRAALAIPAKNVLVKGGHLPFPAAPIDILRTGDTIDVLPGNRIDAGPTHGTGCVLSTGIACRLALGDSIHDAVFAARQDLQRRLRAAFAPGKGARCLV